MTWVGIWRHPAEESLNLYPGLVVHDGRCVGSITAGVSRLPLWALIPAIIYQGWNAACLDYAVSDYHEISQTSMAEFLGSLLDQRGEFGRLLLILADVERRDRNRFDRGDDRAWHEIGRERGRVVRQLRRCLEALEAAAVGEERAE